jgi:hypothetical protein
MRWLAVLILGCSSADRSAFAISPEWECRLDTTTAGHLDGELRLVPSGFANVFKYRVCIGSSDLSCRTVLATGTGPRITADVPEGGFLEIDGNTIVWPTFGRVIGSLPPETLSVPADGRGHLMVRFVDCDGNDAEHVRISVTGADESAFAMYYLNSGFSGSANATGPTGLAAVIRVPAGTVTVHASISDKIFAERAVTIRANSVTTFEIRGAR